MKRFLAPLPLGLLLALFPAAARSHAEHGHGGGFVAGFLHPISGPDHVVAMVAVGLWGAVLGGDPSRFHRSVCKRSDEPLAGAAKPPARPTG
jgi:hydrogenase/urease accessory protein HupE